MKLKSGKTYWSENGMPLYCTGKIVQSGVPNRVGMYLCTNLIDRSTYYMTRRGRCVNDDRFTLVAPLHWLMALELVCKGRL